MKISDRELKLEFEFSSRAENIGTENIGIELYWNFQECVELNWGDSECLKF
jgi:hypothetical protein